MSCAIRIKKRKLCAGDLRHRVAFQRRNAPGQRFGETAAAVEFTPIKSTWAAIETPAGARRFDGVNADDRPTHIVTVRRDAVIKNANAGDTFIALADGRRLRVLTITRDREDPYMLIFNCSERGDPTAATRA